MKKICILLGTLLLGTILLASCGKSTPGNGGSTTDDGYKNPAEVTDTVQTVTTKFSSRSYAPITVQAGVPVKWTIQLDEKDLNGCNNKMQIPEYGITQALQAGETVIEFVPEKTGTVPYSCWMGMIRSQIVVVDSLGQSQETSSAETVQTTAAVYNRLDTKAESAPQEVVVLTAQTTGAGSLVTIPVGRYGYEADALVVQRGVETQFQFDLKENSCAEEIFFPTLNQLVDLTQTPVVTLVPEQNFMLQCSMGMYGVPVFVVDDLDSAETQKLIDDIKANPGTYAFQGSGCAMGTGTAPGGQGGGCCG